MALPEIPDLSAVAKDMGAFLDDTSAKVAKLKEMQAIAKSIGDTDPELDRILSVLESMVETGKAVSKKRAG